MVVKLKCFGLPATGVDRTNYSAEIPAGSTVEGLLSAVLGNAGIPKSASYLVNNTQASITTILNENDEVIVMRPITGG